MRMLEELYKKESYGIMKRRAEYNSDIVETMDIVNLPA